MERNANEERPGHHGRQRPDDGVEELGADDQEFSSIEDVGPEPTENPSVDDV